MKKLAYFMVIGLLLFSGFLFAQTTQGPTPPSSASSDYFGRGGYTGPVLGTRTIMSLLDSAPNEFVIVEGYLIQQRVPGSFILASAPMNYDVSVVVHINQYFWSNLRIDANTPVLVYGTVNRSDMRIEIEGIRIEINTTIGM